MIELEYTQTECLPLALPNMREKCLFNPENYWRRFDANPNRHERPKAVLSIGERWSLTKSLETCSISMTVINAQDLYKYQQVGTPVCSTNSLFEFSNLNCDPLSLSLALYTKKSISMKFLQLYMFTSYQVIIRFILEDDPMSDWGQPRHIAGVHGHWGRSMWRTYTKKPGLWWWTFTRGISSLVVV